MAKTTYKSLYQQVLEEIEKKVSYSQRIKTSSQLSNNRISPIFSDEQDQITDVESDLYLTELLRSLIEPRIINGLCVKAHNPINNKILVYPGKGISFGNVVELKNLTELEVPFDGVTEVYYVVLWADRLMIQKNEDYRKLVLAKIIVPNPPNTITVVDNRDDDPNSWNAYIMMRKPYYLYGDCDGIFEEDTLDLLRENIGAVLADNLIGNIRLSEDLKIINTQGTMELNSSEMKFFDTDENMLAKFDREGTYFYDTNGVEVAKFTTTGAKVGNINVDVDGIRSGDFQAGLRGFEITDTGYAEFENVTIRGRIASSVFEQDTVSAVGGQLIVANSTVIEANIASGDTTITLNTPVFSIGDILWIKDGTNSEKMLVTGVSGNDITVTRDYGDDYSGANPTFNTGTAIVSTGNGESGVDSGYIILDAQSSDTPYLDVVKRNSDLVDDLTTRVRLGNLEGINDPLYGLLDGYGLYSDNVYLTGHFYAPDIKTAITGSRIEMNTYGMEAYDSSDQTVFTIINSGVDEGDVIIGNDPYESGNNGLRWDSSECCLYINGEVDIAGTMSADCITAGRIHLERGIIISSTDPLESGEVAPWTGMDENGIVSYNCLGEMTFCLNEGRMYAYDIRLQDPLCDCIYTCLGSGSFMFHDECGDTDYLKRIATGCDNDGTTVYLQGWKDMPEIAVFPVSLYTYSSEYPDSSQKFHVYYDNVHCYCVDIESGDEIESGMIAGEECVGTHYGWKFDVHGLLFNADGVQPECIYSASMNSGGFSFSTLANTCATKIQFKFNTYRTLCSDLNWQYGSFIYHVCATGGGSTVVCDYYYEQPHGSILQLKSYIQVTQMILLPIASTWCICVYKDPTCFDGNTTKLCARNYSCWKDLCTITERAPDYDNSLGCKCTIVNGPIGTSYTYDWRSSDANKLLTPIVWTDPQPSAPYCDDNPTLFYDYCCTYDYRLQLCSRSLTCGDNYEPDGQDSTAEDTVIQNFIDTPTDGVWFNAPDECGMICVYVCAYDGSAKYPDEIVCVNFPTYCSDIEYSPYCDSYCCYGVTGYAIPPTIPPTHLLNSGTYWDYTPSSVKEPTRIPVSGVIENCWCSWQEVGDDVYHQPSGELNHVCCKHTNFCYCSSCVNDGGFSPVEYSHAYCNEQTWIALHPMAMSGGMTGAGGEGEYLFRNNSYYRIWSDPVVSWRMCGRFTASPLCVWRGAEPTHTPQSAWDIYQDPHNFGGTIVNGMHEYSQCLYFRVQRNFNYRTKCWCVDRFINRNNTTFCVVENIPECTEDNAILYSRCDYFGCFTKIDEDGIIGWLAIGYQ